MVKISRQVSFESVLWNGTSTIFKASKRNFTIEITEGVDVNVGAMRTLYKEGKLKEALQILNCMTERGIQANDYMYVGLLQQCVKQKAFVEGKQIHAHILKSGLNPNIFLSNTLVNMYVKCGDVAEAQKLFNVTSNRDVCTWTIMIAAYVKNGYAEEALNIFLQMEENGVKPDEISFVSVISACASLGALQQGKRVHSDVVTCGMKSTVPLGSTLIDMYSKCGSLEDAWRVFLKMPNRDTVTWNLMIAGYADHSYVEDAFRLLMLMEQEDIKPNEFTFLTILSACTGLEQCKCIHVCVIKSGIKLNPIIFNILINSYAKYWSLTEAHHVFDKMAERDVISWNAMISEFAQYGHGKEALKLFWQMEWEGLKPDRVTFASVLKACSSLEALEEGKKIHVHALATGLDSDVFVASTLIDMYGKCGKLEDAHFVFEKLSKQDVVSWNTMIAGYVRRGRSDEALDLFWQMVLKDVKADDTTFVIVLKACSCQGALEQGKQIHAYIDRSGIQVNMFVRNTIVDMYVKCGSLEDAHKVFNKLHKRDVVSWNALIAGYAQHDHPKEAFELYLQMEHEDVKPDRVTFLSILKACASLGVLKSGKKIHASLIERGYELDVFVRNTLVDMYAKCGSVEAARQMFNEIPERDVVAWNAMIAGYSQQGHAEEALKLFLQLLHEGVKPNYVTFISVLKACASLAAIDYGKQIHVIIRGSAFESELFMESALVDMYAKCGNLEDASTVFENMVEGDVVSCNAMIAGYAQHGHANQAFEIYQRMQLQGVKLDRITFLGVLSACSHGGLVDEGREYFKSMSRDHGIMPTTEHYACMVDLLGRSGHLEEALDLIDEMQCQPSIGVWMALLSACRMYGNVEQAQYAVERILELEPQNTAAFVLLSNIYATVNMCGDKIQR